MPREAPADIYGRLGQGTKEESGVDMPYVIGAILLYAMVPVMLVGVIGALAGPVGVLLGVPLLIWIPMRAYRKGFGSRSAGVKVGVWALYVLFTASAFIAIVVVTWASATAQGNAALNAMSWGLYVALMVIPLFSLAAFTFSVATPRAAPLQHAGATAPHVEQTAPQPSPQPRDQHLATPLRLPEGVQRASEVALEERGEVDGQRVGDSFGSRSRRELRDAGFPGQASSPQPSQPIWDEPGRDRALWLGPPPQKMSVTSKILLGILIGSGVVFALAMLASAAGAVIILVGAGSLAS